MKLLTLLLASALIVLAQNPVKRDYSCSDAAANDTYACNLPVAPANYAAIQGKEVMIKFNTSNTGTATLNLNTLGATTIMKLTSGITTTLADNDIRAGMWGIVVYDGTNFQLISQLGNASGGGGGSAAFADITTGSNTTAAMTVGTGASIAVSGTGTVTSNVLSSPTFGTTPGTVAIANAGTTGTTVKKLAKLTGAPSTAVIAGTGDTSGLIGIVVSGAGTTGSAQIARIGQTTCAFDGATTAGNYVQVSSTSAGSCHDAGSTYPTSGQVLGFVTQTIGSAGDANVLIRPDIQPTASGGSGCTLLAATGDVFVPGFAWTMNAYPQGVVPHKTYVSAAQANTAMWVRRYIPCAFTPNKLSVNVATAGGSGCLASIGVYNSTRSTLLFSTGIMTDATTQDCDTSGVKTFTNATSPAATGMGTSYPAGWYWFASTSNEAVMQLESASLTSTEGSLLNAIATQMGTTATAGGCGTVSGLLPADFSACAIAATVTQPYVMVVGY